MFIRLLFNIFTIVGMITLSSLTFSQDIESSKSNNFSGLYFFAGGGDSNMKDNEFSNSRAITVLRYGSGISFPSFDAEVSYRSFSDGKDLGIKGIDTILKKRWLEWKNIGLLAGAGGYAYRSKVDNSLLISSKEHSGISPLVMLGGYYKLNEYIDIELQYERIFDLSLTSPRYDKKTRNNFDQLMLSLVIRPWGVRAYPSPIVTEEKELIPDQVMESVELFMDRRNSGIYAYDSFQLTDSISSLLDEVIMTIKSLDDYKITITGSADSRIEYIAYNEKLAFRRAKVVAEYLERSGIDKVKIQIKTYVDLVSSTEKDNVAARKVTLDIHQK